MSRRRKSDTQNDGASGKAIVRSVRFKPEQWATVEEHARKHGIRHGTFLRNVALKAAGYGTEVEDLLRVARDTASAIARAVEAPAEAAESVKAPQQR